VTHDYIYCANAGDARAVLCEKGKALDLSKDHKPDLPQERKRIVTAGHFVEDGRVDGVIAISRALGDWEYKNTKLAADKMAVSGYPDITKTAITANTEFVICACDGIWDCMTSQ
jgi:serine/threonine protein phosphatase PrpC